MCGVLVFMIAAICSCVAVAVQGAVFFLVFFQKIVVVVVLAGHFTIEAVTLRSKQPSLIHTYRTKKGSTLTSLFAHALGGPNFPRGVPILQENLFWAELTFGGSKFCVTDLISAWGSLSSHDLMPMT